MIDKPQDDSMLLAGIMNMMTGLNNTVSEHVAREDSDRDLQRKHNAKMESAVDTLKDMLDSYRHAFPDDDFDGHRNFHQEAIQSMRDRREFVKKMTYELSRWGLLGLLGWLLITLWKAFLLGPK